MKRALFIVVVCAVTVGWALFRPWHTAASATEKKLVILGIDGMDPQLLKQFMAEGAMPNFSKLAAEGSFHTLQTAIPPQSPVAWSNVITGMNAGGHGIFDFIHRDPKTMEPYLSTSQVLPPKHSINLGCWVFPLGAGQALQLRHGKAFWEILDQHKIPAVVFHMPSNFPPIPSDEETFAGMGTPDLRGGYGTFYYYTNNPTVKTGELHGGEVLPVSLQNSEFTSTLTGPDNSFRNGTRTDCGDTVVKVPFTVAVDPSAPVAKVSIQGQEFVLREGEWSNWVRINFSLVPGLVNVRGISLFYLKEVHPYIELYISPVNIDPADPALPLSTPSKYSRELAKEVGEFYTQGIAEDTKALQDGIFDTKDFLEQSHEVAREQRSIFEAEFPKFKSGLFFFYFSSLDTNGHMLWRTFDPKHPNYDPKLAMYAPEYRWFYQDMDQILGEVMARADKNTTIMVISDHGFAPFYKSFNLNTWLLQNGYITLLPGANQEEGEYFANVDWSKTRAYGLGLNGLYVNMQGREKYGIVPPSEADALIAEISKKLLAVRDPQTGLSPITRMDAASHVYQGRYARTGPDVIVGYNRGYRGGWESILGSFPKDIIENNTNAWSGDHCMDYTLVPGVILSNRKIEDEAPALTDIAPTILSEFQIPREKDMIGQSVFQSLRAAR